MNPTPSVCVPMCRAYIDSLSLVGMKTLGFRLDTLPNFGMYDTTSLRVHDLSNWLQHVKYEEIIGDNMPAYYSRGTFFETEGQLFYVSDSIINYLLHDTVTHAGLSIPIGDHYQNHQKLLKNNQ